MKKHAVILTKGEQDVLLIDKCLGEEFQITQIDNTEAALTFLRQDAVVFIFIDYEFLDEARWVLEFKDRFRPFWHACPGVEIIMMCDQELTRGGVYAVIGGAYNYLTYPLNPVEIQFVLDSYVEQRQMRLELDFLRDELWQPDSRDLVSVVSPTMKEVVKNAKAVAPTNSTVLITGETGSGKSVLAQLIHKHSKRSEGPFIPVHCSAIPDSLLESELFGHERGAFTGAIRRKMGKFEAANGGTIFLDEIGTIPPVTQIKLLQVLQERIFSRVGGDEMIDVDVRIIAATNANLMEMIDQGTFRGDLFYRLNVFPITVPPLRHRKADIPLLVEYFLMKLNETYFKEIRDVHPEVAQAFADYHWPGNIRELENLVERAYILEGTSLLQPENFPTEIFGGSELGLSGMIDTSKPLHILRERVIAHVEHAYLSQVMEQCGGVIKTAAEITGVGVRQLHKLLNRHKIDRNRFRQSKQRQPMDRPKVRIPRITPTQAD